MFGRKVTFGKKQHSLQDLQSMAAQPDSDGVRRVFSKELWDDPDVGGFLSEMGYNADDERNVLRSGEEWIALFEASKQRLMERLVAFNRTNAARYGHFEARPFLLIGPEIFDGEHGAFLYSQLELLAYEDWNVMFLAGDPATKHASGLPGHPGRLPALEQKVAEKIITWRKRHDFALETWGVTATGGHGISREDYLAIKNEVRCDILAWSDWIKPKIEAELLRIQAD